MPAAQPPHSPLRVVNAAPATASACVAPPAAGPDAPAGLEHDLARGLFAAHAAIGSVGADIHVLVTHLYALTEVLIQRGVLSLHELDERKAALAPQMSAHMREKWIGARMLAAEDDKYDAKHTVHIDCAARVHLCKAACCRFGFHLSRQDVEEAVVKWDVGRPYHIRQDPQTGYCVHHDGASRACRVHAQRPLTCRVYDCRNDARVWTDFERRIPNPSL